MTISNDAKPASKAGAFELRNGIEPFHTFNEYGEPTHPWTMICGITRGDFSWCRRQKEVCDVCGGDGWVEGETQLHGVTEYEPCDNCEQGEANRVAKETPDATPFRPGASDNL